MILHAANQPDYTPKRIVSLVPSQTELLHYLGSNDETVGITKFCVHPENWFISKMKVGGTKNINQNVIHTLQPDLIIANKEENVKEQIEELAMHYPVWVTDVNNLEDACQMINDIGQLTNKKEQSQELITKIKKGFSQLSIINYPLQTAYLIWQNPYMAAGGDTFINDMLNKCGLQNVFAGIKRYPEITIEQIKHSACKLLLLSSEPYPFKEMHISQLQLRLPEVKIILADGEMFSWYGSRLLQAVSYFEKVINSL